jgi:hypothetical protein
MVLNRTEAQQFIDSQQCLTKILKICLLNVAQRWILLLSWARDVMGESKDVLEGSCFQNTLKNKRLEHQSYRQKRNFIDRERLSRETDSRVQELGAP